jgi:hypothetical protein
MSGSEFLAQANVTVAAFAAGNGIAHSAKSITHIKTRDVLKLLSFVNSARKLRELVQGNSTTSFEEHVVRGALRFKSSPPDLEIQ